jgi:DNA-binding LacI/PurR family transcriptional regulator
MEAMNPTPALFEKSKDRPLREQVREHLRQQCLSSQPDMALPTLRQMSEAMGVNHVTISKALRDLEEEGILSIIPGKGTFVTKSELISRSIEMVSFQTPSQDLLDTSRHTFKGMQDGLHEELSLFGTTLLMPPVPKASVFLQTAKARNVDALAIFGYGYLDYPDSFLETQFIYELAEQMPVVLVGKEHSQLRLDCVYCDPAPQMQTFLSERYDDGARKFEYLGVYEDQEHLKHRFNSFQEFLLTHGLIWQYPAYYNDMQEEVCALLDKQPQVIVVSSPSNAHQLVIEAQRRGLQLGSELQILCFAGSIEQVRAIAPYVSVILLEEEEVGRCVIKRLHNRLTGVDKPAPLTRRIPGKLVRQTKNTI